MRRIVLLALLALLAHAAGAQRRGGFARGFGRPAYGLNRGSYALPYDYRGYGDYGYAYSPYAAAAPYAYAPQPVVFLQPPIVEPPPREVHPVVTNYDWPAPSQSAPSEAEPRTFAIVLKDGSIRSATAVIASSDGLHCVDPDERHIRISMSEVDRAATLRLNRARRLNLYLPATP